MMPPGTRQRRSSVRVGWIGQQDAILRDCSATQPAGSRIGTDLSYIMLLRER
jgi:hypothetical protein